MNEDSIIKQAFFWIGLLLLATVFLGGYLTGKFVV